VSPCLCWYGYTHERSDASEYLKPVARGHTRKIIPVVHCPSYQTPRVGRGCRSDLRREDGGGAVCVSRLLDGRVLVGFWIRGASRRKPFKPADRPLIHVRIFKTKFENALRPHLRATNSEIFPLLIFSPLVGKMRVEWTDPLLVRPHASRCRNFGLIGVYCSSSNISSITFPAAAAAVSLTRVISLKLDSQLIVSSASLAAGRSRSGRVPGWLSKEK
jgi:hypothetical protein